MFDVRFLGFFHSRPLGAVSGGQRCCRSLYFAQRLHSIFGPLGFLLLQYTQKLSSCGFIIAIAPYAVVHLGV